MYVCVYYVCTADDRLVVRRASFSLRTLQTAAHRAERTQASLSSVGTLGEAWDRY